MYNYKQHERVSQYLIKALQMQQDPGVELQTFFTDPLLLSYITEYLSIADQLVISTLSKKLRFIIEGHFTSILKDNKLNLIPNKSSTHQMNFYFGRCLRIFKHFKEQDPRQELKENWQKKGRKKQLEEEPRLKEVLKATLQYPFKFKVIIYFKVGPLFTAFLDSKDRAYVFRTNQLIHLTDNKGKVQYIEQPQVRYINTKAERMVLVKANGEVVLLDTEKASMDLKVNRQTLPWTMYIPVKKVYGSFTYALFELQNPFSSKQYLSKHLFQYNIDLAEQILEEHENNGMYFIAMNMINNSVLLVKVPVKRILNAAAGHKQAYFVDDNHQCFIVEFQHINEGQKELVARPFLPLSHKKIIRVSSGYNFFVAIERNIQHMEEWNTERVAEWLREIGFGAFVRIARAEKVDGIKLKTMEKKYMENVLGITKLNMQQKLILCIEEVIEGKNQYDQLWVWGKNEFGQLGTTNANYIAQPQKVKMDFLQEKDRIDRVFCGWHQTFVRTQRGKIYSSAIGSQKKKKKTMEEKDAEEGALSDEQIRKEAEDTNRFKNNKKRKFTEDYKQKTKGHHKKFEEQQRWNQLEAGKAFFVSAFKDYTFIIQCPAQNKFEPIKQRKLRTAKAVIDKILWAGPEDKSQFKIGIIDKDMGTIEVSLLQIQSFDYKENSIRYVKRNNIVVWDRENKIDYI